MEVKTIEHTEEMKNKTIVWKQCLEIVDGYKQLNINNSEELKNYFKEKENIPNYVKISNINIFEAVENFNNTEDEQLKEKYQNDAIYEQTAVLQQIAIDLEKNQKLYEKVNKKRNNINFEKKKKANKKAKKSRNLNYKRNK